MVVCAGTRNVGIFYLLSFLLFYPHYLLKVCCKSPVEKVVGTGAHADLSKVCINILLA